MFCTILLPVMKDVLIAPIFDQAKAPVWEDFLHIRNAATFHVTGSSMNKKDYEIALEDFVSGWLSRRLNFAFGAYDEGDMVAFIQGMCIDKVISIQSLYVLPEYMKRRLGCKLLQAAEKVHAFGVADSFDLISLVNAQKFYEKYDYKPISAGSNHYVKNVRLPMQVRSAVVPVFKPVGVVVKACKEIAKLNGEDFDSGFIKKFHAPLFVYVDCAGNIQGFATASQDLSGTKAKIYLHPNHSYSCVKNSLTRAVDDFYMVQCKVLDRIKTKEK